MGICASKDESTSATSQHKKPAKPSSMVLEKQGDGAGIFRKFSESYASGKELGRGQFGVTYLCTRKGDPTNTKMAVKVITKDKLVTQIDVDDVRREVSIMLHLKGYPSVVRLNDNFEDERRVYLVQELCEGGELFDRIIAKVRYSEHEASRIFKTMLEVVKHCHDMGVMHRDLKPENFLMATTAPDSEVKCTDFGLSVFFTPNQVFKEIVGSAYYVAPEVLRKNYQHHADVWSLGVILYILLSGVPPFYAETEKQIFQAVLKGHVDFKSNPWPRISSNAKDLIMKCLVPAPKRSTAADLLSHPWFGEADDKPLETEILTRLRQFSAQNKLKKKALNIASAHLSQPELNGLRNIFRAYDANNDGYISVHELKESLVKAKQEGGNADAYKKVVAEIQALMSEVDEDGSGGIDYNEFLASTINSTWLERVDLLQKTFMELDTNKNGLLSKDEVAQVLDVSHEEAEEIMKEVDADSDGNVNFEEFTQMMRNSRHKSEQHRLEHMVQEM